ncbi:MAG: signal peptidase I [Bacteroidaceae bacterium]|nr:signal peptidase I [Bacteroidaceae bacterium]
MLWKIVKYLLAAFLSVPLLYGAWLLSRMLVFDYFTIPTESMYPTLKPGYKVIVNKLNMGARIYTNLKFSLEGQELEAFRMKGYGGVKHNDIVVFNEANHNGKLYFRINNVFCKRVIALPGDSISAVNSHYKNNNYDGVLGLESEQTRMDHTPDSLIYGFWILPHKRHVRWNMKNFGPIYVPRKDDIVSIHALEAALYEVILEWETSKDITWDWVKNEAYANGKPFTKHRFKHNYYFMAGDNVINSYDSRYCGVVPEEYIVGVVT